MKNNDCELKEDCMKFLGEFPDEFPQRCHLCTPLVKHVLERLKAMHEDEQETPITPPISSSAWWNNGYI